MQHPIGCFIASVLLATFLYSAESRSFLPAAKTKNGKPEAEDAPLHDARLVVVAAHHDEDLAWLDGIAQNCTSCHVYVYTTSHARAGSSFHHGTIREVPNVGREWGKYLRFILDEWPAIQQSNATLLFLHAHQWENSPDDDDRGDVAAAVSRWPAVAANHILYLHGSETELLDGSPNPLDYGELIRRSWPQLFSDLGVVPKVVKIGKERPYLDLFAVSGAEFSVPACQITRRPRRFYEHLEQWLLSRTPNVAPASAPIGGFEAVSFDYAAGSIMELLAYRIFQGSQELDKSKQGMDLFVTPQLLQHPLIKA